MDAKTDDKSAGKCPFTGNTRGRANRDCWPNQLDIQVLHRNSDLSDPMSRDFNYAQEFNGLDSELGDQGPACVDDGFAGVVAMDAPARRKSSSRTSWRRGRK